jgi:FtsZ-interacting cell division protein YlmF
MNRFEEYLEREEEDESAEYNVLQASLLWNLCAVQQQRDKEAQKRSRPPSSSSSSNARRRTKKRRSREPKLFEDPTYRVLATYNTKTKPLVDTIYPAAKTRVQALVLNLPKPLPFTLRIVSWPFDHNKR